MANTDYSFVNSISLTFSTISNANVYVMTGPSILNVTLETLAIVDLPLTFNADEFLAIIAIPTAT